MKPVDDLAASKVFCVTELLPVTFVKFFARVHCDRGFISACSHRSMVFKNIIFKDLVVKGVVFRNG